jgi:enterochelin esterase family protein
VPVERAGEVTFELRDRSGRLALVRLVDEVGLGGPLDLRRTNGVWRLVVARPDVARMEYLFEIEDANGRRTTIPDPANPRRAPGAFGDKSVIEFADYHPPAWADAPSAAATETELDVRAPGLDEPVPLTVWAPDRLAEDEPAPLLVVHDGPEYARLGGLTDFLGTAIAAGSLPAMRAALVAPGDRNGWYSANPAYARALPRVLDRLPPVTFRIGLGVSLGALAMLHVHRRHPGLFGGLFLQSGSFFTAELDPQESQFSGFPAVSAFVGEVAAARSDPGPVPTVLTCGTVEENLANNRAMAEQLRRLGYPTELVVVRDAHNFTAWRDALDPHLTRLVTTVAARHAA